MAIPEAAAVGGAAAAIAPIFLKAIQQSPSVAKIIWPIGSIERESIEITTLYSQLDTVIEALGPRISNALAAVQGRNQSDISDFLAFAGRGDFSGPRAEMPDLVKDTSGLLIGFTTFLVSEALVIDGWHVDVAEGTNPLAMSQPNATCPAWSYNCGQFKNLDCYSYDDYDQCTDNYWWHGKLTNSAYSLSKDPYNGYFESATKNEKDPTQIMHTIFSNGWSTGQLLLENAGLCVLEASLAAAWSQVNFTFFSAPPNDPAFWGSLAMKDLKSGDRVHTNESGPTSVAFSRDLPLSRPNETLYNISQSGIDFNCTSQLNLTILRDWPSVWYLHRKLI